MSATKSADVAQKSVILSLKLKCNIPNNRRYAFYFFCLSLTIFSLLSLLPSPFLSLSLSLSLTLFVSPFISLPLNHSVSVSISKRIHTYTISSLSSSHSPSCGNRLSKCFRCSCICLAIPFPYDLDTVSSSDRTSIVSVASSRLLQWQIPFMDGGNERAAVIKVSSRQLIFIL